MAANLEDVKNQLRNAGLLLRDDRLEIGRMVRCKVDGDREKRGWYSLHEINMTGGDVLIVGSYGIWLGRDNGARKIELTKRELSSEQRESLRRRAAEDRKRADAARKADAEKAAQRAAAAWNKCLPNGECDYLARKGVEAYGLRFSPRRAALVPMLDTHGKMHGLQVLRPSTQKKGRPKQYWPPGVSVKGHFHLMGLPTWIVLVAEGYASAASIHEATGLPTAVAFDAGNMPAVAHALAKHYRGVHVLMCADDDQFADCLPCRDNSIRTPINLALDPEICPTCSQPHKRRNTGVEAASLGAMETRGAWVAPHFADDAKRWSVFERQGHKRTDFNDLHQIEGLHVVRAQIQARLTELKWSGVTARDGSVTGEGEGLRPIGTLEELLERYALVYGKGGTVFDHVEHQLLSLSDMRDACVSKYVHRSWAEHPNRIIVRETAVGFDPPGEDPLVTCNLWAGWPTVPREGKCDKLLDLLMHMCGERDDEFVALYNWVLRWIAYPIQHPGAKMESTLVLHGPQGVGKNVFFEALMSIYGTYGGVIDQAAIEDKFNDWASKKLFLIADEVVARSDLYHVKNKLKAFITGKWIRINPKQIQAYNERNHVNIVFLSNELIPVVLEEDDRRHGIIWTPTKLSPAFYAEVGREIANGGVAALHDYLLKLDLGDFTPSTKPPETAAKRRLIDLSLDSTSRYFYELQRGDLGVDIAPALSEDIYTLYKAWCTRSGLRAAPLPKLIHTLDRKHDGGATRKRWATSDTTVNGPHGVLMFGKQCPPGANEQIWLGNSIATFRTAMRDYMGKAA